MNTGAVSSSRGINGSFNGVRGFESHSATKVVGKTNIELEMFLYDVTDVFYEIGNC